MSHFKNEWKHGWCKEVNGVWEVKKAGGGLVMPRCKMCHVWFDHSGLMTKIKVNGVEHMLGSRKKSISKKKSKERQSKSKRRSSHKW